MTYHLIIGNRLYFSWSLAAFLMFDRFDLAVERKTTVLRPENEAAVRGLMQPFAPARTLPTVIAPDGAVLSDSMAIAEELASRHPEVAFWPRDALARGTARALANEMHSSFGGLRGNWPFNLRTAFTAPPEPADVTPELDRLEEIFAHARRVTGPDGPWLCGDYSLVDAIFAPMAVRLATYGFDTRPTTAAYVAAHLADPSFRRWRAMARANEAQLPHLELGTPPREWPGPTPVAAKAVENGPSENAECPYSGLDVTHFLELEGRTFGFCNAFCRDKTINDPAAWPKFMAIYNG